MMRRYPVILAVVIAALGTPIAASAQQVTTICSYRFVQPAVGWQTHTWTATDCTNGLPQAGSIGFGQGQNGAGKSGQVECTTSWGAHYNHDTTVGATEATVTCFFSPPPSQPQPFPPVTTCSFTFNDIVTGWRTHQWTAADCSNGLPPAFSFGVGQGMNGGGTAGMVWCDSANASHYNHPTDDGATNGRVICSFIGPSTSGPTPELTACDFSFSDHAAGWRTHTWTATDCTNGLPSPHARGIGQAVNGAGGMQQASCSPTAGAHYNPGVTTGRVRCVYQNLPPPTTRATVCTHHFADAAVGWRSHAWTAADCSNGLPQSGWVGFGQGQNGAGKSGQVQCTVGLGLHFNHGTKVGPTDSTVTCFFAPPPGQPQPVPGVTTCSYSFSEHVTGWRTHQWTAADCSNGLPLHFSPGVGHGQNGGGTAGMAWCDETNGSHYNHPTDDEATGGTIVCTFLDSAPRSRPEFTFCDYSFAGSASGWQTHTWIPTNCTHGLPAPGAWAVGQAVSGAGGMQQARCLPESGSHHSPVVADGRRVRCLFQNAPAAAQPDCSFNVSPQVISAQHPGTTGTITVTTQPWCSWQAFTEQSWIHVVSGASGTGSGTVAFSVGPQFAAATRTGKLSVAGQSVPVSQSGTSQTLKYFGYFRESDFENYMCEIQDHANFTMIGGTLYNPLNVQPTNPQFAQAASYGIASWGIFGPDRLNGYLAKDDADVQPGGWVQTRKEIEDEVRLLPFGSDGVPLRPMITLAGQFLNEPTFSLPSINPDPEWWIGLECYDTLSKCQGLFNGLRPHLRPNHRVWILPPGISPEQGTEAQLVQKAEELYAWAQTEPAIVGMMVFVYQSTMAPGQLATRDLPNLRAKYRQIGNAITGRNRTPLTNCVP